MYLSFVSSLSGNRTTLLAGVIVHVSTFLAVAGKTGSSVYVLLSAAFFLIFCARMAVFRVFDRVDREKLSHAEIERWERIQVAGAACTTAILGIGSGYAIFVVHDSFAELACISVTMATMVSVVGRNYGSRMAVDLQTFSCCLPMIICGLMAMDFIAACSLSSSFLFADHVVDGDGACASSSKERARAPAKLPDRRPFRPALNNMPHGLFMVDPTTASRWSTAGLASFSISAIRSG